MKTKIIKVLLSLTVIACLLAMTVSASNMLVTIEEFVNDTNYYNKDTQNPTPFFEFVKATNTAKLNRDLLNGEVGDFIQRYLFV